MMRAWNQLLVFTALALSSPSARAAECDAAAANPQWVFCHDFELADADDFGKYWNDVYGVPDRTFIHPDNPEGIAGSKCMRLVAENTTSQALTSGVTSGPKKFLGETVSWDALYVRWRPRSGQRGQRPRQRPLLRWQLAEHFL